MNNVESSLTYSHAFLFTCNVRTEHVIHSAMRNVVTFRVLGKADYFEINSEFFYMRSINHKVGVLVTVFLFCEIK